MLFPALHTATASSSIQQVEMQELAAEEHDDTIVDDLQRKALPPLDPEAE
jgi:hypothetical protein